MTGAVLTTTALFVLLTEAATASNVAAGLGDEREITVPTWLTVLTGAAAVGASGLLAAFVTDRRFVASLHGWSWSLPRSIPTESTPIATLCSIAGLVAFGCVLIVGLEGPAIPTANLAVIIAFVGLRSLLPIVAILVVNPWPAIDPFRTIVSTLTRVRTCLEDHRGTHSKHRRKHGTTVAILAYPRRLRSWPAVIGLIALVFIELLLPVTTDPHTLALVAASYAIYTICGTLVFGPTDWFRRADPLSALFRLYGAVAPIQRSTGKDQQDGGGYRLALPGSRLRDPTHSLVTDSSDVALIIVLVWELTFNGFIVTPPGARTINALVALGVGPLGAYALVFTVGLAFFVGGYALAARLSRRTAPTFLSAHFLAERFAPPLLAIAAGYHLAHYVAFTISLTPAALAAISSPFTPPVNPTVLAVPGWVGTLEIGFLLAGHLLAIWTAHAVALELFPGRLQAIRSQYPFVIVMICYTGVSLWLLSMPAASPPFVG